MLVFIEMLLNDVAEISVLWYNIAMKHNKIYGRFETKEIITLMLKEIM